MMDSFDYFTERFVTFENLPPCMNVKRKRREGNGDRDRIGRKTKRAGMKKGKERNFEDQNTNMKIKKNRERNVAIRARKRERVKNGSAWMVVVAITTIKLIHVCLVTQKSRKIGPIHHTYYCNPNLEKTSTEL
ncbi:hypothetical protein AAHE18_03G262800 [Arachis hypogaea]